MAKALYGLLGYPVKHSLSPVMHNAAFEACSIDAEYRLFEIKPVDLQKFLFEPAALFRDSESRQVKSGDVAGFNITIPHKVAAKEMLEERFGAQQADGRDFVRVAGAVNTVRRDKDSLQYRNTDAPGFLSSLRGDLSFDPKDKTVLLLGCGGAGRAIVAGLTSPQAGVKKIYIYENDEMTVRALESHFAALMDRIVTIGKDNLESAVADAQLVVNATPLGMHDGDPSPLDKNFFHKNLSVYDVVYNKITRLVLDAREKKLPACGGLGMLLYQGVLAWEFWTGKQAPVEVMRQALKNCGILE